MFRFIIFGLLLLPMVTNASVFDVLRGGDDSDKHEMASDSNEANSLDNHFIEIDGTYRKVAVIAVLNKITARSKQLSINVGQKAFFGNIEIEVHKCWSNKDLYFPTHMIFVTVMENKLDEDPKNIFNGWIISSNIQVSVLENPSYELIATQCRWEKS